MTWFRFWLILHILAVILAFGPSFAYGLIIAMGRRHPQHMAFAVEVVDFIEKRLATPLAVLVPLLGTALIYAGHHDLWASEWLIIAIVWYAAAFFFAILVQTPATAKMLRLVQSMPPGPPPEGGPPPEVAALGKRLQVGGTLLGLSVIGVLVLMVWQPGGARTF